MSRSRLEEIRLKEKLYHDNYFANVELFQEDSWLEKPVKSVMETFDLLPAKNDLRLLDLGCGVGRNSIPLAQRLRGTKGKVVCIDILESAITYLERYGKEYGVSEVIEPIRSEISDFQICPDYYDYVISVSTLEHLDSITTFHRVLEKLIHGTREQGIHCFLINSNIRETEVEKGAKLIPLFEILFETDELLSSLRNRYANWTVLRENVKRYTLEIMRDEKRVLLESDVVTWVAKKL
jgi:2-polyprenyl-3-methyl-5-hydroxy-6-metoxy-1,4-benzoquinol methylase